METTATNRMFSGAQQIIRHASKVLGCDMNFAIYLPDEAHAAPCLFWLSGLTCTEENFVTKAGAQRIASELGCIIVAPDTSPRGEDVPDDPEGAYDFGLGAGFYVNATESPWSTNYKMQDYIEQELYQLVLDSFSVDDTKVGIFGHSMGGHGALTIALRNPDKFKSVSAFAPIVSPLSCPWGHKALNGYLGEDQSTWRKVDACALIEDGARASAILVDQGSDDGFLTEQLKPELLQSACDAAGIPLTLRMQSGFDHSYFFIATYIEDHIRWHLDALNG